MKIRGRGIKWSLSNNYWKAVGLINELLCVLVEIGSMIRNTIWVTLLVSTTGLATEGALGISERALPLTIEVTRDVQVRSFEVGGQQRGTLYAAADFTIEKGQSFQMIAIGQEGGCRIVFQGAEHELSSCPWLPGFRDHQQEIFLVLPSEKTDEM